MAEIAEQPIPDDLSEQTTAQSSLLWGVGGILWGAGGTCGNPCGFPDYEGGYLRSYATYRWMLKHPIIRQARHMSLGKALAAELDFKKSEESVPDSRIDLLKRNLSPLWPRLLDDGLLRGRDFGWASFEPVWDSADGETRLCEMKPLSWDMTQILAQASGAFSGLSQGNLPIPAATTQPANGLPGMMGLPAPYKAWLYTHDGECGNLYGRSWLENIRETAWKEDLDCAQQLQKLSSKIAGVQAIAMSPAKSKASIEAMVKGLVKGAPGAWLETFPFSIPQDKLNASPDLWKIIFELAKTPLQSITPLDFGSAAPAIVGILERRRAAHEMMFAGALLSPRTGMEGRHGTNAEAKTHTDSGVTIAELYLDNFSRQLQPLVDAILVLNDGPDAAGSVTLDPPPLEDAKAERAQARFAALSAVDTPIARGVAKMIDWQRELQDMEAPLVAGAKFELEDPTPPPAPFGQPPNDGVPVNVNGKNGKKVSPRVQQAKNRLFGGE